jgi:hypothetical protein
VDLPLLLQWRLLLLLQWRLLLLLLRLLFIRSLLQRELAEHSLVHSCNKAVWPLAALVGCTTTHTLVILLLHRQ